MWHASARYHGRVKIPGIVGLDRCHDMLRGVGDDLLGEWVEAGTKSTIHVRRRLSEAEQTHLEVRDIRRTPEAMERLNALPRQYRAQVPQFIVDEEVTPN